MSEKLRTGRNRDPAWPGAVVRAMAPWCLLWIGLMALLVFISPPSPVYRNVSWWQWSMTAHLTLILPFVLFAGGVALASALRHRRQLARVTAAFAIVFSVVCYGLEAWATPVLNHRRLADAPRTPVEARRFGPRTPVGLLNNLRYVEANPPDEYSLGISELERRPPNELLWRLHHPLATAVFSLVNVFLGVLSGRLTTNLRRGSRRNVRLAIGILGGLAYFGCMVAASPIQPFLQDGTMRSGILSAWAPIALPLAELLLLFHLVRAKSR